MIGQTVSHYRILEKLGAGGMGVVYKAEDVKLGRFVALKFLPPEVAGDSEVLGRFQREAKVLASLNHPNIATIHGLEDSGGTHALVMELVPGPTLADRIAQGPIPIDEALRIAKQITDALEYAHERGIIHRDLKPANIKVTNDDSVKVLDFGLAKALDRDPASPDIASSPTISHLATQAGMLLGTAAYMSPEQARGKAVDRRADIWAFGCVLYEMLTGRMTFRGDTVTDILAVVIRDEPDWSCLSPATPARVRVLLQRCLQKDPKQRLRDIGDARISLDEVLSGAADPLPALSMAPNAAPGGKKPLLATLVALLLLAALAGMGVWYLKPSPLEQPQPVTRTTINLPPGRQLAGLDQGSAVALSADGSYLAYVASQNGAQQIYLRPMNSLEAKPIAGTEGAVSPFFSPDDRWLGFFADGNLRKIYVSGGAALNLAEAPKPAGAAWSSAGLIAFAPKPMGPIQQILPSGGSVQPLTRLRGVEFSHRWPAFLPNSKAALFSAGEPAAGWSNAQVGIQLPGGSIWRTLIEDATYPQYASSGHLVYAQNGNLMAVPFDPKRMATAGSPVPVVEGVLQSVSSGASHYAVSENGTLVYVPGTMQSTKSKLVRVSRDGKEQPLAAPENTYREPRFSPDGKQIAVDSASQVWIYNSSRESLTPFTFGGSNDAPVWSPDGKQIAFQCHLEQAAPNLCLQMADGSGAIVRLTNNPNRQAPNSWSSDGETLAYIEVNPATGFDIWTLHVGDRKATPFLQSPFNESAPRFSPDGHWLAYISDESGRFEIYVQPFPGPGGKWQISTDGGTEPVWNPNGRELFYHNGTKLMAVGITTQPAFSVSKPHVLFEGNYVLSPVTFPNYDVAPDGQYFLMFKPDEQTQAAPAQINVVLNWFQELRRLAPPAKQ